MNLALLQRKTFELQAYGTVSLPLYPGHVYVAYKPDTSQQVLSTCLNYKFKSLIKVGAFQLLKEKPDWLNERFILIPVSFKVRSLTF